MSQIYNPRKPILMLKDRKFFYEQIPSNLVALSKSQPLVNLKMPSEEVDALNRIVEISRNFMTKGPEILEVFIYEDWAKTNGIITKERGEQVYRGGMISDSPMTAGSAKYKDHLTSQEWSEWDRYLAIGEVTRETALEIAKNLAWLLHNLPDLGYGFNQVGIAHVAKGIIYEAQFKVVLNLVPDVKDPEVKKIFGKNATKDTLERADTKAIYGYEATKSEVDLKTIIREILPQILNEGKIR